MSRQFISSGLLLSISVLALNACSGGQPKGIEQTKSTAPVPPIVSANDDTLTPVTKTETTVVTSTGDVGVATNIEDRMAKLENAVGSLRTDYDRIMPAFASLNTTNERIQSLLTQIETDHVAAPANTTAMTTTTTKSNSVPPSSVVQSSSLTQDSHVSSIAPPGTVSRDLKSAPVATTTSTTTVSTAEAAPSADVLEALDAPASTQATSTTTTTTTTSAMPNAIKGIRIGEHGNKTRLVIDLATSMKPEVTYDVDNTEKLMLVDMPTSGWYGVRSGTARASAFVESWSVTEGAKGGSSLAIQLKKDAKILSTEYLKAQGKDSARLVIDIGPAT